MPMFAAAAAACQSSALRSCNCVPLKVCQSATWAGGMGVPHICELAATFWLPSLILLTPVSQASAASTD